MKRVFPILAVAACSISGACLAPTRTVHVRVSTPDGAPVAGAHIRAIGIDASSVPLPVSLGNVLQSQYGVEATSTTNADGAARLEMYNASPHLIEVNAPPLGEFAGRGPWAWVLEADGRRVTAAGVHGLTLLLTIKGYSSVESGEAAPSSDGVSTSSSSVP